MRGLVKRYGDLLAVDHVDLEVERGTVLGLLGPNGAGKTTTIDCLTTLLVPDEGHVEVGGVDVVADPAGAREQLAVTGQSTALDDLLTGRENLELFGRLRRLDREAARRRAADLLDRFSLSDAADRAVKTYSGGMRRRLDLAASLVVEPRVLFLDEPTTGLDPRSREELWETVRGLRSRGMTVVLTTQYLEEADQLADRIVVIDRGRAIADGTAAELKARIGGTRCDVQPVDPGDLDVVVEVLEQLGAPVVDHGEGRAAVAASDGAATLAEVLRRLDAREVELADIGLRTPSLDDVFFALTGHTTDEDGQLEAADAGTDGAA